MGKLEEEKKDLQTQIEEVRAKMTWALDEVGRILKEHEMVA